MRAAIFDAPGKPLRIDAVADPAPGPGEIVVRVHRCGICGSDLHMTDGHGLCFPNGTILGHEFSGEVVAVGREAGALAIGDRVAVMPAMGCGACAACLSGAPARCRDVRIVGCGPVPGGYAEYARAPAAGALRLPDDLSYEDGALLEPLAVALRGVAAAGLRPGARVAVLGAGPIGLGAAFWAQRLGAANVAMVAGSLRREALGKAMGAGSFMPAGEAGEAVPDALGGAPEIVFECSGQPGAIASAIGLAAPGGTVVVLGTCGVQDSFFPPAALVKEIGLRFSFMYDLADYRGALAALAGGATAPRRMVTGHVELAHLPEAFEALRGPNSHCKLMITPAIA